MDKGNLRTLQLGIGPYENPQLDSPAIHESRILFFQLIEGFADYEDRSIEFKSDAPARLCDDILPSFTACVFEHFRQTELSQIRLKSLKSDADLYGHLRAKLKIQDVLDFIPNQATLKRQSDETYRLITSWAQDWNLSNSEDGWCLDFAIRVLSHWIFDPGAREFKFWNRAFKSNRSSAMWDAIEFDLEKFSFEWETGLFESSGWNPRIESIDEWRHRASDRFETTLSSLKKQGQAAPSGTKGRFKREQAGYVSKIRQGLTGQQLRATPRKRDIAHFLWTVHFQVAGLPLSQVCEMYSEPSKTVSDGVNRTLELIGLPKREELPAGRKIGTKRARNLSQMEQDRKRSRLRKFLKAWDRVLSPENKASVARKIGVSPQHFRREWVPYLLKETGCSSYISLIESRTIKRLKRKLNTHN